MKTGDILVALRRLKVETGSLACMGCGCKHICGIHGCRIVRDAAELIEKLTDRCARYAEEIAVLYYDLLGEFIRAYYDQLDKTVVEGDMTGVVAGMVGSVYG